MRALAISPLTCRTLSQRSYATGETIACGTHARVATTSAVALNAPSVLWPDGATASFIVEDSTGNAATNPITISGNGRLIDGAATYTIRSSGVAIAFLYDQVTDAWITAIQPRKDAAVDGTFFRSSDAAAAVAPLMTSPGWQTALDVDFRTLPSQALDNDQDYTIGGRTWTKRRSANATSVSIVNGTGLVFVPTATSDVAVNPATYPRIDLPIAPLMPGGVLPQYAKLRLTVYNSALNNGSLTGDSAVIGFYGAPSIGGAHHMALRGGGGGGAARLSAAGLTQWAYFGAVSTYSVTGWTADGVGAVNNVFQLAIPAFATPLGTIISSGTYNDAGNAWPTELDMASSYTQGGNNQTIMPGAGFSKLKMSDVRLNLGATRNGSATALVCTFARLKLEYSL